MKTLEENLQEYLTPIVTNYLKDREVEYDTLEGTRNKKITAETQQGSMLNSDLSNTLYDGIRRLEVPEDCFLRISDDVLQ